MDDRRNSGKDIQGLLVHPGEIVVVQHASVLVTVVSFGVCVCMWDKKTNIGGISHFVKPRITDPFGATAVFGNVAVQTLVRIMCKYGAHDSLEAQIFGGASHVINDTRGALNAEIARAVLIKRGVPIASDDTGGNKGRKLLFDTQSGHVAVLKVHSLRQEDWS